MSLNLRFKAFPMQSFSQTFKIQLPLSDLLPVISNEEVVGKRKGSVLWLAFSHQECLMWNWEKTDHRHTKQGSTLTLAGCSGWEGRHAAAVGAEHEPAVTQEHFLKSRLIQHSFLENSSLCKKSSILILLIDTLPSATVSVPLSFLNTSVLGKSGKGLPL